MPIIVPIGTGTSVGTGVTTYSGLVASVSDWLNRSDLDSKIPDFIALLEARLNRELRVPDMEDEVTLITDSENANSLPTDFLEARALYLDVSPRIIMRQVSMDGIRELGPITGSPEVYAVSGGFLFVAPVPTDSLGLHLNYYQKIPALSSDNEINWLISAHPDVYLWGALVMAEAFLWNDERVPGWKSLWDEAIESLKRHGAKARHGGSLSARHTCP